MVKILLNHDIGNFDSTKQINRQIVCFHVYVISVDISANIVIQIKKKN